MSSLHVCIVLTKLHRHMKRVLQSSFNNTIRNHYLHTSWISALNPSLYKTSKSKLVVYKEVCKTEY